MTLPDWFRANLRTESRSGRVFRAFRGQRKSKRIHRFVLIRLTVLVGMEPGMNEQALVDESAITSSGCG